MLKRIWILVAIFLVGLASFNLLNKPVKEDDAVAYQEDPSIAILREKLHEKYVGVDVKTTTEKELVLQVVANEKGSDKDAQKLAKEIEETVNEILQSKDVAYEIKILNTNGEVVN